MIALAYSRNFPNEMVLAYAKGVQTLAYVATNRIDALRFVCEHEPEELSELSMRISAHLPESALSSSYFVTGFAGKILAESVIERAEEERGANQLILETVEMWIMGMKMMPKCSLDEVIIRLITLELD